MPHRVLTSSARTTGQSDKGPLPQVLYSTLTVKRNASALQHLNALNETEVLCSTIRNRAPAHAMWQQGLITDLKNDLDLLAPVQKAWKAIILQTMLHEILAVSYKSAAPLTLDCDMFFEITSPVPHP